MKCKSEAHEQNTASVSDQCNLRELPRFLRRRTCSAPLVSVVCCACERGHAVSRSFECATQEVSLALALLLGYDAAGAGVDVVL